VVGLVLNSRDHRSFFLYLFGIKSNFHAIFTLLCGLLLALFFLLIRRLSVKAN